MSRIKKLLLITIPLLLFAAILSVMLIYNAWRITDYTVIGNVDGMDIYAGELTAQMSRDRANVIGYYHEKDPDIQINSDFWSTPRDGITPVEYLRDYAMESVVSYKLQQKLGLQFGKVTDASYKAFVNALSSENKLRADKIAAGQVVYGAREYTADTYYEYTLSNLAIALQAAMSEDGAPLAATEQQYREFYRQHREEYYKKVDNYELVIYSAEFSDEKSAATAKSMTQKLEQLLEQGADDKQIAAALPKLQIRNFSMNNESYTSLQKGNDAFYEAIVPLRAGERTAAFENQQNWRLVRCTDWSDGGCKSYEEVGTALIAKYNQVKYDELVAKMCKDAKLVTNDKYERVN